MLMPKVVAENTKVKVTLYPLLPGVRTLDLQMHSDTFPNFWLLSMREQMQKEANELIGVPVAFVSRHRADIAAHYSDMLDSTDEFKRFHVNTDTTVVPSENMTLLQTFSAFIFWQGLTKGRVFCIK